MQIFEDSWSLSGLTKTSYRTGALLGAHRLIGAYFLLSTYFPLTVQHVVAMSQQTTSGNDGHGFASISIPATNA